VHVKVAISPVILTMMVMVTAPCGTRGWTPTRAPFGNIRGYAGWIYPNLDPDSGARFGRQAHQLAGTDGRAAPTRTSFA